MKVRSFTLNLTNSKIVKIVLYITLSWFYAFCSQIVIPLPFNCVPLTLQPLPLFLSSLLIGWPAVFAYFLTLFQGALGAPFFSFFQGGITKLLGPTGGYILGFAFAMIFLVAVKNYKKNCFLLTFLKLLFAFCIYFTFGVAQLSFFITPPKAIAYGFYPFIVGDLTKITLITIFMHKYWKLKE